MANKSYDYSDLIKDFGQEKMEERYSTLHKYLES